MAAKTYWHLAIKLGTSQSTISLIRCGKHPLSPRMILAIYCHCPSLSIEQILELAGLKQRDAEALLGIKQGDGQ